MKQLPRNIVFLCLFVIISTFSWLRYLPNGQIIGQHSIHSREVVFEDSVTQVVSTHQNVSREITFAKECLIKGRVKPYSSVQREYLQQLTYPTNAHEHFRDLHDIFSELFAAQRAHTAADYHGPWIENVWISTSWEKIFELRSRGGSLKDVFGIYIPLLFPLTDLWVNENPEQHRYPVEFMGRLLSNLRADVIYVTVSQNDLGIYGAANDFPTSKLNNILVLSAGGYGHVPIPLLKGTVSPCPATERYTDREFFVSFAGSNTAPNRLRESMIDIVTNFSAKHEVAVHTEKTSTWESIRCSSRFSLCPRGFGRTSYRLAETVQSGRIPVVVFSDVLWVPYIELFKKVGYFSRTSTLESTLELLQRTSAGESKRREELLLLLRDTHFSLEGVLRQIYLFLLEGELLSDLRCQALPLTVRDE